MRIHIKHLRGWQYRPHRETCNWCPRGWLKIGEGDGDGAQNLIGQKSIH